MTVRVAPSRLPTAPQSSRSRAWELIRGLLALLVLGALVVVVPVALYRGFGTPWPDHEPAGGWLYATIDATTVLNVLVAVVWLAWAHFVVCVLVELIAERRGRGLSPAVPGGAFGTQPLARRLIAAVLMMAGGAIAVLPTAGAATSIHAAGSVAVQSGGGPTASGHHLGSDRSDPGTTDHDDAKAFVERTGNHVEKFAVVQPPNNRNYDCLWDIAERYLGDGLRYKEVYELNRDIVQPDGRRLTNPDLIQPGWILKLPHDADGPGLQVHEAGPSASQHGASQHGGSPVEPPQPITPGGADEHGAGIRSNDQLSTADDEQSSLAAVGGFAVGGALLAAGLLIGLRRRRGWDGGPDPRGGKQLDDEFALRGAADEPSANFLDRAIRSSGQFMVTEAGVPASSTCALEVDGLALGFSREARVRMDPPWHAGSASGTWTLRRADAADIVVSSTLLSPYPGLVPLGRRHDGAETFVDVESVGALVSLSGDLDVARQVAMAMAVSLATAPWGDGNRVTFVGFADELSALGANNVRHVDDLDTALEGVDARRRRQQATCATHGFDSVRSGRVGLPDGRIWAPEFLVLSGVPDDKDVDRLAALASDARCAIGVVVLGDVPSTSVRLIVSTDGRMWSGPLGIDVHAHRLEIDTYRDALDVFDADHARGDASAAVANVPLVDPDAIDLDASMPVEIRILGPLEITAPGPLDDKRRGQLTELVTFLALHPEGVHPNVLAAAIWPRGVDDEVRDSTLAQAAEWFGADSEGEPRLRISGTGRWQLSRTGVRVDWDVFRVLANRAASSSAPLEQLERALGLVRGPAWTGLPAERYGWLAYETLEADVRVGIVAVARSAAHHAVDMAEPMRAREALLAGLRMVPACEPVWRDALRLAHQFAGTVDVTAVADDMYAAIARHGSPLGAEAETDAVVDALIPGYRKSAA
jgi:LysM domain